MVLLEQKGESGLKKIILFLAVGIFVISSLMGCNFSAEEKIGREEVFVYAYGPGKEKFFGLTDNTHQGKAIFQIIKGNKK